MPASRRLADQQLAGAIMWIPAGAVYLVAALTLLVAWVGSTEREAAMPTRGRVGALGRDETASHKEAAP